MLPRPVSLGPSALLYEGLCAHAHLSLCFLLVCDWIYALQVRYIIIE